MHLFCDCSCVGIIWQDLQNWLSSKLETNFNFTKTDLLFDVNLSCNNEILNCILLCYRFYIYRCKTAKQSPKFEEIFEIIRNTQRIEKIIANKQNNRNKFNKKWSSLNL